MKSCSKNRTNSSIITFTNETKRVGEGGLLYTQPDIRKKVYLIDGKLYCGHITDTDYFHEIVVEYGEEEEVEEEEEEEKEYDYYAYSLEKEYKVIINVAGGGMMNGNAYANIEGEWETEEDYNNGIEGEIFYCEYGRNEVRKYVGKRIVWGEDDNFNIE